GTQSTGPQSTGAETKAAGTTTDTKAASTGTPGGAAATDKPLRASVPEDIAPDELTVAKARELLENAADGDRELGTHPETGRTIVAKSGRFGPYVTEELPPDAPKTKGGKK